MLFGWGGDKNIIHIASMPKTLVFTVFSSLCTTHCARMWNRTRCHKRPCVSRPCPKHWYLRRLCVFLQHIAQDVEQGKLTHASMLFATMPKTLVFKALLFLYGLRVADSGLTHSVSEAEAQCNKEHNVLLDAVVSWMSNYHAFLPNRTKKVSSVPFLRIESNRAPYAPVPK